MTGIQATNEDKKNPDSEKKLTDETKEVGNKKNSDSELQIISSKVETIDKDLDTRFNDFKKSITQRTKLFFDLLFDFYCLETFKNHIDGYKIVLQSVTSTIEEGKEKKESSSSIIFELTKIPLSVESKDEEVKKQIKRSNTLKELYLSTGKSVAELEVIITHCRNNTLDSHNKELVEQVQLLQKKDAEKDKEIQGLKEREKEKDKKMQEQDEKIELQQKEIQTLKTENTDMKQKVQLLAQQMIDVQKILGLAGQGFNQPSMISPSSSLSDSDIEMIDMPSKKHS